MKTDRYARPPRSLPIGYRMAGVLILLAMIAVAYTKHPCELPDGTIDAQCANRE